MSAATLLKRTVEASLSAGSKRTSEGLGYIRPSSLAYGCLLYVARELLKTPKPEFDNRVKRILDSGTSSHYRISKYLTDLTVAKELPFVDEEYRIRGQCDALVYVPATLDAEKAGFYVVEIKTMSDAQFDQCKQSGQPRDDHLLQCQIYIWGLARYYPPLAPRGGILYYENRNTLEYLLFDVEYDEERIGRLFDCVKQMLTDVRAGRLPEHQEPVEHCGYCAYLDICEVGQQAMAERKREGRGLPDHVLAKIIAERIVKKQKLKSAKRPPRRSLEELSAQWGWDSPEATGSR